VSALLVEAVVRNGDVHITEAFYQTRRREAAKHWGDGVELRVTIEPVPMAIHRSLRDFYFAAVVTPMSEFTGYTKASWHRALKRVFMPDDGRTSIMQLSHQELKDFIEQAESELVMKHPEAFAEFDSRNYQRRSRMQSR
jgi:hypothetical protein